MDRPREFYEDSLSTALSRSIGYTTGAYSIERIASIASLFGNKPSLYQTEITQHLVDLPTDQQRGIERPYAAQILNFAVGLRIIEKVADGPTQDVNRFALTPEGTTVKAALEHSDFELLKFVLTGLVLEADCDFYALTLEILQIGHFSGSDRYRTFKNRYQALRSDRLEWLVSAFPNRMLRDRVTEKVHWVPKNWKGTIDSLKPLSDNFARHHVTPRVGWGRWFGHIDRDDQVTESGEQLLRAVKGPSAGYVWLGPPSGTLEALRIPESQQRTGPWSPSWDLLRPPCCETSDLAMLRVVDEVANFMETHYDSLRLVNANQAFLGSIRPYIYFTEQKLGYSVREESVLERIFATVNTFSLLSMRQQRYGYYQLRDR